MSLKPSNMPQDIYHRIYCYAKKNIDPRLIAHGLNLPIKTVMAMIDKLKGQDQSKFVDTEPDIIPSNLENKSSKDLDLENFIDVFVFVKTRYIVLDISGMLIRDNLLTLSDELVKLKDTDMKAVAIRLADVTHIDEDGLNAILQLHHDLKKKGRFTAILDPSADVDAFMLKHGSEEKIPIFGTESAFEAKAFK